MKLSVRVVLILMAVLAFGQILWWAHLIISQQNQIAVTVGSSEAIDKSHRFFWMILAEGFFFLVVWSAGIWLALRAYSRDLALQRQQADFMSAITHELKTPLANVRLCLDTLERPNLSEEMRTRYISRGQGAIDKLVEEVDSILALTQSTQGETRAESFEITALVEECLEDARKGSPVSFDVAFESSPRVTVAAPYQEVRVIIKNLIDNALKYSSVDGNRPRLTITVQRNGKNILLSLKDNGLGFTPEELSHAFEPFYRGDEGKKLSPTGTGLGLSLVKRLAAAHGIGVSLESAGRGNGSTVTLVLAAGGKDV